MMGRGTRPNLDKKALGCPAWRGFDARVTLMFPTNSRPVCLAPNVSKRASRELVVGMAEPGVPVGGATCSGRDIVGRTVSVSLDYCDNVPSLPQTMAAEWYIHPRRVGVEG